MPAEAITRFDTFPGDAADDRLWSQHISSSEWVYWECRQCGAIGNHSLEVVEAALQENQIGTKMQRLADAGRWLILDPEEDIGS